MGEIGSWVPHHHLAPLWSRKNLSEIEARQGKDSHTLECKEKEKVLVLGMVIKYVNKKYIKNIKWYINNFNKY